MSIFSKIFKRETRSTIRTDDPYIAEFFGMQGGLGGYVDPSRASGLAVAQACINVIAQNLAATPLNVYARAANGGREKAIDYPLYTVLHDQANEQLTAFEFRELMITSLLISGNAFAEIIWNSQGQVTALFPIDVSLVTVELSGSGRVRYRVTDRRNGARYLLQEEMLHIRYRLDKAGVMGLSPIQLARDTFNLALTQQETAGKQAAKSFRTEGVFSFPNPLPSDKKTDLLNKLQEKIEKNSATSGVLVLDGGAKFDSTSLSAKDAEFLESRKLTNLDICRIFSVPPTVAGITDNSTYSNTDQESRALVQRCLAPMAKRVEQAMNSALLLPVSRKSLFIEHDLDGLLRGDLKGRYESYQIARNWGWLSPNEIRAWENLPDIKGGDEYLSPLNMTTLGNRDTGNNGTGA
jgi:HK97 family phage portal protein